MVTIAIRHLMRGTRRDPVGQRGTRGADRAISLARTKETHLHGVRSQKVDFMGSSVAVSAGPVTYATGGMTSLKKYQAEHAQAAVGNPDNARGSAKSRTYYASAMSRSRKSNLRKSNRLHGGALNSQRSCRQLAVWASGGGIFRIGCEADVGRWRNFYQDLLQTRRRHDRGGRRCVG